MTPTRYATVHYRKLVVCDALSLPLATAVANALKKKKNGTPYGHDWQLRVDTGQDNPPQQRFINNVHSDGPTAFGVLCVYAEHEMQALVATRGNFHSANVVIADSEAPQGNDYLHGIAYWLIVDNHCYVVQHPRATTKTLEGYLTWLLRETSLLGPSDAIVLRADFDVALVGGDLDDVTSIEVGGLVADTVHDANDRAMTTREVEERRSLKKVRPILDRAKAILEGLFGELGARQILDRVPHDAALDVTVNIGYRSSKRKVDRSSLRDMGIRLRNIGGGEVRVRSRSGTARDDDFRLHMKMPFKLVRRNGSLLDLDHARSQLRKVHDRFTDDGKIMDED